MLDNNEEDIKGMRREDSTKMPIFCMDTEYCTQVDDLPELRLLQAILARGISDLYGADGDHVRQDALRWLNHTDSLENYGSFDFCCSWLNLDKARVLEALTKRGYLTSRKIFRGIGKLRTGPNKQNPEKFRLLRHVQAKIRRK